MCAHCTSATREVERERNPRYARRRAEGHRAIVDLTRSNAVWIQLLADTACYGYALYATLLYGQHTAAVASGAQRNVWRLKTSLRSLRLSELFRKRWSSRPVHSCTRVVVCVLVRCRVPGARDVGTVCTPRGDERCACAGSQPDEATDFQPIS